MSKATIQFRACLCAAILTNIVSSAYGQFSLAAPQAASPGDKYSKMTSELDFDKSVVDSVHDALGAVDVGTVSFSRYSGAQLDFLYPPNENRSRPLATLQQVVAENPGLKPFFDSTIKALSVDRKEQMRLSLVVHGYSDDDAASLMNYLEMIEKWKPYTDQEFEAEHGVGKLAFAKGFLDLKPGEPLDRAKMSDAIKSLEMKYSGKTLGKRYAVTSGMVFSVRAGGAQRIQLLEKVRSLQKKLSAQEYGIFLANSMTVSVNFDDKKSADKYMAESGMPVGSGNPHLRPGTKFELTVSNGKLSSNNPHDFGMQLGAPAPLIPDGAIVKSSGEGSFTVVQPEQVVVSDERQNIVLLRDTDSIFYPVLMGTGRNSRVLIEDWLAPLNTKYGVNILAADRDRLAFELRNPPTDLAALFSEILKLYRQPPYIDPEDEKRAESNFVAEMTKSGIANVYFPKE